MNFVVEKKLVDIKDWKPSEYQNANIMSAVQFFQNIVKRYKMWYVQLQEKLES